MAAAGDAAPTFPELVRLTVDALNRSRPSGRPELEVMPILRPRQWRFLRRTIDVWEVGDGVDRSSLAVMERLLPRYQPYLEDGRVRAPANVGRPAPSLDAYIDGVVAYWRSRQRRHHPAGAPAVTRRRQGCAPRPCAAGRRGWRSCGTSATRSSPTCGPRSPPRTGSPRRALEIERVLLVLGSPRGGTSAVHAALCAADTAVGLPGEHRHLFTLLGRNYPDHGRDTECDDRPLSSPERAFVHRNIAVDLAGPPLQAPDRHEIEVFAWRWALRFRLQWPAVDVPLERLVDGGDRRDPDGVRRLATCGRPPAGPPPRCAAPLDLDLDPSASPSAYELDEHGAPATRTARRRPRRRDLVRTCACCPRPGPQLRPDTRLVLKASSDAFRLASLADLFDGWDVKLLHLTRNPLGAVNGLLDGWAHPCFWQHDLSLTAWPDRDRPGRTGALVEVRPLRRLAGPLRRRPRADLCTAVAVIARPPAGGPPAGGPRQPCGSPSRTSRRASRPGPACWRRSRRSPARCGGAGLRRAAADPVVVNPTARPQAGRWRQVRPQLVRTLAVPGVRELAATLGYADAPRAWS